MPRLLGQLLPGALWPFSAGLDGRAVAAPAPCSSGFWLFLGPNSITQTRENLSPVNSIQVQGLGHQRYADSLLLIVLGPLLPHCSGASSPLTPVCTPDRPPHLFPCVSGISAFLKTLLPSGRYRDLFLIRRHPLCCILRDEAVLLSVHGVSHCPQPLFEVISLHSPNGLPDLKPTRGLLYSSLCPVTVNPSAPDPPLVSDRLFAPLRFLFIPEWLLPSHRQYA